MTYHGPGQLICYLLLDVRRLGIGVRQLVSLIEQSIVEVLAEQGVTAAAKADAPGVYVEGAKIASSACAFATDAPSTAWRLTWTWICSPSGESTPAVMRG